MQLILTHEQADFDAIASQLGAYLTGDSARPVLSRRMNRNVRSFLALYGADLPFEDPRDLLHDSIEQVTLVDTQSLTTFKGMGAKTAIHVVDHHARRESTPAEWHVTIVPCGATTTHFVELIRANSAALTVIQSTLLLLGIYEDTGSLTYSRTTARDVHAAAFLLEQGADLRIAARFLNPPLSNEQRVVYDRLVATAETHIINEQRIVLAIGEVEELTEEISTLAHKLRDLFDPDGLFVLVKTMEGIRLVARSTTDHIDVAHIAAQFGGGGHDRAAAALIHLDAGETGSGALEKARTRLMDLLPGVVHPPVTVAQLMSNRPRTIAPDVLAQDAAKLMQRYGYEGFPVAQHDQVLGLLTRRAVDRAVSHGLNLPVSSLMDAGQVMVHPGDSLMHLQTLMTDSGWGQIPVVHPETGKIIGIVTRTDLLKTLSPHPRHARRKGLGDKLKQTLPPAHYQLIQAVAEQAANLHLPVYIVGGFVRDLLLGRPGLDFDIVVEGDAITVADALCARHGGRLTSHGRFRTAKWYMDAGVLSSLGIDGDVPEFIDLISARQEFYEHPTALPTVEHGSIKLDLHRRDFTINTLALRLDGRHFGELLDQYGGQADLQRGLVRVLHSLSFVDDPTRILRAVRYEQRYGFSIEARTLHLISEAHPLLDRLSDERVRHELDLILDEPHAPSILARLHALGLLTAISDALPWSMELRQKLDSALGQPPAPEWELGGPVSGIPFRQALGYAVWLSPLPAAEIDRLHARLRFPLVVLKAAQSASALLADLSSLAGAPASVWVERLTDVPLLAVYAAFLHSDEPSLQEYAARWRNIQPVSNGDTLKALGLPPGPAYQDILRRLRAAWVDGEITSVEQEQKLLHETIQLYT